MESETEKLLENTEKDMDNLVPDMDNLVPVRRRWITVEPVLVLYFVYYMPCILLVQQYIFKALSEKYNYTQENNISTCNNNNQTLKYLQKQQQVQRESSNILLVFDSCRILSISSTLFLGAYSDFGGRKTVITVPLVGAVLKCAICAYVIYLELDYWYLMIGMVVDGLSSASGGVMTGCFAYIADVSTPEERTLKIIILDVCIGIGGALSQFASGYLIQAIGYLYTFLILVIINLTTIGYVIFMVTETRKSKVFDNNTKHLTCKSIKQCADLYTKDNGSNRRWKLQLSLCILIVSGIVCLSKMDVQTYFLMGRPLCFQAIGIGYFSGVATLVSNMGCLVGSLLFGKCLGDLGLMVLGFLSGIADMVLFTFAQNIWMLVIAVGVGLFAFLPLPMVRSISSKLVKENEQGALNAVICGINTLSMTAGTTLNNALYAATLHILPGFVFLLLAGVYGIGLLMACCLIYFMRREDKNQ